MMTCLSVRIFVLYCFLSQPLLQKLVQIKNKLPQVCQSEPAEEEKEEIPTKSKRLRKKKETFIQIRFVTRCDLFQLVCTPWSQAVVLSHGETWLHHLGKVYFTLTRCFSSYISCSISLTGVTFAKCISSSVTSTTCTVAKHPVAQDLPCKQELEGEL